MTITHSNTIKKIMSFGCSFTMGGGLNDTRYLQWLKLYHPEKLEGYSDEDFYKTYYTDASYPSRLAKFLGCGHENFAIGCSSNELIFKTLNQKTSAIADGNGILITIQPTFLHRKHVYDGLNQGNIMFNGPSESDHTPHGNFFPDIHRKEYNNMYLKYFYDHIYELNKYLYNLYAIVDSLVLKNFSVIIVPYENPNNFKYLFLDSKQVCTEFVHVGKMIIYNSIQNLLIDSNLCIKDLPNMKWKDYHANEQGHEIIAESLYNHIIKHHTIRRQAL